MQLRNSVNNINERLQTEQERKTFLEHALLDQSYEPEPTKHKSLRAEVDDAHACAICLEEYQKGDRISRSFNRRCKHIFHHGCILDWLMTDQTCPCCRQNFLEFYDEDDSISNDVRSGEGNINHDAEDLEAGRLTAASPTAATTTSETEAEDDDVEMVTSQQPARTDTASMEAGDGQEEGTVTTPVNRSVHGDGPEQNADALDAPAPIPSQQQVDASWLLGLIHPRNKRQ